jgi:hypothetical protein
VPALVQGRTFPVCVNYSSEHGNRMEKPSESSKPKTTLNRKTSSRSGAEKDLRERLRFERLLSDLSAKFVNLPSQQMDKEIEQGLRSIVESLSIDRSSVAQFSPDMKTLRFTHTYAAARGSPMPSVVLNEGRRGAAAVDSVLTPPECEDFLVHHPS